MKEFFSKLSLYDFLTTVLLGSYFFFLNGIRTEIITGETFYEYLHNYSLLIENGSTVINCNSSNVCVWLFVLNAFLLGLIIHKSVELITFFNFVKNVKDVDEFIEYKKEKKCICKLCSALWIYLISIFSLLVANNIGVLIYYARYKVIDNIPDEHKSLISFKKEKLLFHYYKAYYYLQRQNKLENVPTLEAHSALLKDLFFVSILLFWTPFKRLAVLLIFVLLIIRCYCECKIYALVWEGYYFDEINNA